MLTIIVPMLNAKKYLRECIDSILAQTYKDMEVLCVDAESVDGTLEILREYEAKDDRVKIIHSKKKSYGYQMNLGLQNAKGDYIGIVEADDVIAENMYEDLLSLTKEKPDFVKELYYQFSTCTGKRLIEPTEIQRGDIPCDRVLHMDDGYHMIDLNHIWSAIYRREFLLNKNIKFNETPGASYQDTSFSVLVDLLSDTVVFSSGIHYFYRIDNEGSSVKAKGKYPYVVYECNYIREELTKAKLYKKHEKEVIKHKVGTYFWNYRRLIPEERYLFSEMIQSELADIYDNYKEYLNTSEVQWLLMMLNNEMPQNEKDHIQIENVIKYTQKKRDIILFGAGAVGKTVLLIQKIFGDSFIIKVVDNDKNKQGSYLGNYLIESPEIVLRNNPDARVIVANKKYGDEINLQVLAYGFPQENVFNFTLISSFYDLIEYYNEKQGM